ncbi:hypothetical protein MBLNU230_g2258t1 [Neophaeotheca triangularis]
MDDGDDDLYGGANNGATATTMDGANDTNAPAQSEDVKMETGEPQEDESDDSDDEIEITLEKPDGTKAEPPNKRTTSFAKAPSRTPAGNERAGSQSAKPQPSSTKPESVARRTSSTVPPRTSASTSPQPAKATLTHNDKPGSAYPEVRTSKVDINANPIWPGTQKHITEIDVDADLAEHSKPWRLPGTDQTDFFNYGFDEYTWTQYCIRQQTMAQGIAEQKRQDEGLKAMLGGGGAGPGPMGGMPSGPPAGPGGMPDMPPEMMQQMMQMMGQGGMDPSQMDMGQFNQFMQGGPGGPSGMGRGGGGMGRGMGGGAGQGASPMPQQGQGFQPPAGPGGGGGGFDPQALMAQGFSQQQIQLMAPGQQGGGRGRGGRRGRGYY